MDFVESIQAEGVELERTAMGKGTKPKTPLVVKIDIENDKKDIEALDIESDRSAKSLLARWPISGHRLHAD